MKRLSFLLLGLLLLMMLAACGTETPPNEPTTPDAEEEFGYCWDKTELILELNENSHAGALSSGFGYLAGNGIDTAADDISDLAADRNRDAENTVKVSVKYKYVPDEREYDLGCNIDRIVAEAGSGAPDAPDMYLNYVYDMTCATLKNAFTNLYSRERESGMNFFAFTEDGYSEGGDGYFYSYMKSLTLSDDKMYCLASDYTVDVIRAMAIIPVNIEMMNGISLEKSIGDKNADGRFDITDFYTLVWNGDFTYGTLATLAEAVYSPESSYNEGADMGDTLGFAVGKDSHLAASALIYTADLHIIDRKLDMGGKYTYSYPETNRALKDLFGAVDGLFSKKGICAASKLEADAALGVVNESDLDAIRDRFADNKILFGGVTMLGSLEDEAYQDMRRDTGFGIAPIPLYMAKSGDNPYRTFVHNLAKVIAISKGSTKFEQCSAFLDYVTYRSESILDAYYGLYHTAKAADNKKMLNYLAEGIVDCFDKTYDDIITNFWFDKTAGTLGVSWHGCLKGEGFRVADIDELYRTLTLDKKTALEKTVTEWNKLP